MALIFTFSAMRMPPGGASVPDWSSHGAVYCVLAILICRALAGGFRPLAARRTALAAALATLYGVTDEWHQMYVPQRVAEVADLLKDLGGALLGVVIFNVLTAYRQRKEVAR
jgi:VanZ family protein